MKAELILDAKAILAEGPVWDAQERKLWWVDIPGRVLHQFDPDVGSDQSVASGLEIGCISPRTSGGLILGLPDGFATFSPESEQLEELAPVEADDPTTRMNDGKCDERGRFWAGTMAYDARPEAGSLYRLTPDGRVRKMLSGVTISNGLDWSPDGGTLYYIDSLAGGVDAFDFDADAGEIDGRRRVVEIPNEDGIPDGMTVDVDGNLWVALYGGAAVRCYRPDGTLEGLIPLPVTQVTSCAFAGDDLGDLYITTASQELTEADRREQPSAGGIFRCRPGVIGSLPFPFSG